MDWLSLFHCFVQLARCVLIHLYVLGNEIFLLLGMRFAVEVRLDCKQNVADAVAIFLMPVIDIALVM